MTPVSGSEKKQVLHFCALGAEEMQKFVEDLKESIAEVTELEQIRIECKGLIQFTLQCHHTACDYEGERVKEEFFRNRGKEDEQHRSAQDCFWVHQQDERAVRLCGCRPAGEMEGLHFYDACETGSMVQWPGVGKLGLSHAEDSPLSQIALAMQI